MCTGNGQIQTGLFLSGLEKKIPDPLKLREPGGSARISLMEGAGHSMS